MDPIGIDSGLNEYCFVENNPVNSIDPAGLSWVGAGRAVVLPLGFAGYLQGIYDLQNVLYLDQGAIREEMNSNRNAINLLQEVVQSGGKKEWDPSLHTVGKWNKDLHPGDTCKSPERQTVLNAFENWHNLWGLRSDFDEGKARHRTHAPNGLPKGMSPEDRLDLATALLARQQSYQQFLERLYW
jgi:hypothetical protein